jgi:hypothetical protein
MFTVGQKVRVGYTTTVREGANFVPLGEGVIAAAPELLDLDPGDGLAFCWPVRITALSDAQGLSQAIGKPVAVGAVITFIEGEIQAA